MAQEHNIGAEICGTFILDQIRNSNPSYRQIFSPSMRRIGDWGWPRPDFVCYDEDKNTTYALEYKPPMQSKREYVCGLGQSITYLQHHTYSGLILPERADDGFPIAEFMKDVMNSDVLSTSPISLFVYQPDTFDVSILKSIKKEREANVIGHANDINKTFWCWWRDMSHYELYDLLNLSFIYAEYDGDAYTDCIFPTFWEKLVGGKALTFEGEFRTIQDNSMGSYKQNYRIPFEQLGLWTSKEGKLSDLGYELLMIGKKYGPNSTNFRNALAYLILTTGHHIDLIHIISEYQKNIEVPMNSMEYKKMLDAELTSRGLIGKRKPSAVKTGKKETYLRDEMKLWNKFDLLNIYPRGYFNPGKGYDFNWEKINEVLINGKQW